jgi:hypothetical protein
MTIVSKCGVLIADERLVFNKSQKRFTLRISEQMATNTGEAPSQLRFWYIIVRGFYLQHFAPALFECNNTTRLNTTGSTGHEHRRSTFAANEGGIIPPSFTFVSGNT